MRQGILNISAQFALITSRQRRGRRTPPRCQKRPSLNFVCCWIGHVLISNLMSWQKAGYQGFLKKFVLVIIVGTFCQAKKNWCWVWGGTPHGDLPDLGSIHFDKTTDNVSSFNLILKKIVLVIIVGTFCQVNELTFLYTALLGFVYPLHRFMK